jgi:methionine--tRNA ligase beta chain
VVLCLLIHMSISYSDFQKIDLRVGKIKSVEEVEGLDKILKLTVDLGELGERIILAGVKGAYRPNELLERSIVIVANLEPREIKGIKSEGMLLAVTDDEDRPILLIPEKETEPGSQIS